MVMTWIGLLPSGNSFSSSLKYSYSAPPQTHTESNLQMPGACVRVLCACECVMWVPGELEL